MELRKKVGDLTCRAPQGEQKRSPKLFIPIVFTSKITRTCCDAGWWTALRVTVSDRGPRYALQLGCVDP
eukprot:7282956-Prymnesium_polylepis.1